MPTPNSVGFFTIINKHMTEKQSKKQAGQEALEDAGRYSFKSSGRGGPRVGAGRPKGSGHKVRLEDLMSSIELATGVTYAEQLANNYADALERSDWGKVMEYDKAFLNKLVADKSEVTVTNTADDVDTKRAAFEEALAALKDIK